MDCKHDPHSSGTPGFWRSRSGIGFIVIGAVAGYFLITEHLAHVIGVLPYLLLLACPLMHMFMHHGHGRHGGHGGHDAENHEHKNPEDKTEQPKKGDRS